MPSKTNYYLLMLVEHPSRFRFTGQVGLSARQDGPMGGCCCVRSSVPDEPRVMGRLYRRGRLDVNCLHNQNLVDNFAFLTIMRLILLRKTWLNRLQAIPAWRNAF